MSTKVPQMPISTAMEDLRQSVRAEMARQNVTAADVAEKAGIAKGTLDNFLSGSTLSPSYDRVFAIMEALGMHAAPQEAQPQEVEQAASQADWLAILQQSHAREICALEKSHEREIGEREKRLADMQRSRNALLIMCGVLMVILIIRMFV